MNVLYSENLISHLRNANVLLDNDFLSSLHQDKEYFRVFFDLAKSKNSQIIIDPFTKLEFLRDSKNIEQRKTKKSFIELENFFLPANIYYDLVRKQLDIALFLSDKYKGQATSQNKKNQQNTQCSPSTVDLLLAARSMLQNSMNIIIITGNKKDYPSFLFDLIGTINYEEISGSIKTFSLIEFKEEKSTEYLRELQERWDTKD